MKRKPRSKRQCPDCHECQVCSETRCRACRGRGHVQTPTLARFFTHGDYLEWKKHKISSGETPEGIIEPKSCN